MATAEEERARRIEDLVRRVDSIPDRESRETAHSLMEEILELHGSGIERMMDLMFDSGDAGKAVIRRFASDPLVSSLLILHNLHPDDIETRVHRALGKLQANAELLGVFEGVVRVRLTGGGCGAKQALEASIREAAPDLTEIVIQEVPAQSGFVPLEMLGAAL